MMLSSNEYNPILQSPRSSNTRYPTTRLHFGFRTSMIAIAIAFAILVFILFFIDTDGIINYSRTTNPILRSATTGSSTPGCPDCQGIFRPSYDYEANYENWDELYGKTQSILLLGERHSGTNWIADHLVDCFGKEIPVKTEYLRFKHWFQSESSTRVPPKSAVVISMFRDPYDWVWAMKGRPHHAHDHINLPWLQFVTKPWVGNGYVRGRVDRNITKNGMKNDVICLERYSYKEIFPCSRDDELHVNHSGYADYKYELMHDGSERAYPSIVNLRKEKIENHLSVSKFEGPRAFYPFRYEDLSANGTEVLLNLIESATGCKRTCEAVEPKGETEHKKVPEDYVKWMNEFVDWDVEALVGYSMR